MSNVDEFTEWQRMTVGAKLTPYQFYAAPHGHFKDVFAELEKHAAVDLSPLGKTVLAAASEWSVKLRCLEPVRAASHHLAHAM